MLKVLSVIAILVIFSTNFAYGQYMYAQDVPQLPQVMLHLILRDSEKNLVAYIQADQIVAIDPTILDGYLDAIPNKKAITNDGRSHQIVQWQGRTETINQAHAMTLFTLYAPVNGSYPTALEVLHNSYQVNPGDTVTVYWTVIRPIS